MINKKIIFKAIGILLYIFVGFFLLCFLISFYYKENDQPTFIISIILCAGIASLFFYAGKGAKHTISRRDGYIIVATAWIVSSLIGMSPYLISGYINNVNDAFFETISGFTSTGATILDNIESFPHGLLFWRSVTQWIGGLGIVFFTIAVLPMIGTGGIKLFAAEATGPTHDKVHSRISVTAKWIWMIYIGMTVAETILLRFSGMGLFDSLCHALTTCSTGGFSTKQESIASFHSPRIEYIITIFMFLSGINYTLLYTTLLKLRIKKLFYNTEFRWYFCIVILSTLGITTGLYFSESGNLENLFRRALFQVVSIQSSTGFMSDDYMLWMPPLWMILCLVMIIGSCAGSTAGGIKCIRLTIMCKVAHNQFKQIIHPNAVFPVRINRQVIPDSTKTIVLAFMSAYLVILFFGWLILMALGMNFTEAFGSVITCLSNSGPALGSCGPAYSFSAIPTAAKWVCSFLMLAGRLELFTILILFMPSFWKKL